MVLPLPAHPCSTKLSLSGNEITAYCFSCIVSIISRTFVSSLRDFKISRRYGSNKISSSLPEISSRER